MFFPYCEPLAIITQTNVFQQRRTYYDTYSPGSQSRKLRSVSGLWVLTVDNIELRNVAVVDTSDVDFYGTSQDEN